MRLCRIGRTDIVASPLVLLLPLYAMLTDRLGTLMLCLTALALHELSHIIMAKSLGYMPKTVTFHVFGCSAEFYEGVASLWNELAIACAGPLFSLIVGLMFAAVKSGGLFMEPPPLFYEFGVINIALGLINLLPGKPLDGGRALCALLSLFLKPRLSLRLGAGTGIALGGAAFLLGAYRLFFAEATPSLMLVGFLLLAAAAGELKRINSAGALCAIRRDNALRAGEGIRVLQLAVSGEISLLELMRMTDSSKYTVFSVLGGDMRIRRRVDEAELYYYIEKHGVNTRLNDVLYSERRKEEPLLDFHFQNR